MQDKEDWIIKSTNQRLGSRLVSAKKVAIVDWLVAGAAVFAAAGKTTVRDELLNSKWVACSMILEVAAEAMKDTPESAWALGSWVEADVGGRDRPWTLLAGAPFVVAAVEVEVSENGRRQVTCEPRWEVRKDLHEVQQVRHCMHGWLRWRRCWQQVQRSWWFLCWNDSDSNRDRWCNRGKEQWTALLLPQSILTWLIRETEIDPRS